MSNTIITNEKEAKDFAKNCKKWESYSIDVYPEDPSKVTDADIDKYNKIQEIINWATFTCKDIYIAWKTAKQIAREYAATDIKAYAKKLDLDNSGKEQVVAQRILDHFNS